MSTIKLKKQHLISTLSNVQKNGIVTYLNGRRSLWRHAKVRNGILRCKYTFRSISLKKWKIDEFLICLEIYTFIHCAYVCVYMRASKCVCVFGNITIEQCNFYIIKMATAKNEDDISSIIFKNQDVKKFQNIFTI